MSRRDLFFQKIPGRGSVEVSKSAAQHIVLITALLLHIDIRRPAANLLKTKENKNDNPLKTLETILRLALDFDTIKHYI